MGSGSGEVAQTTGSWSTWTAVQRWTVIATGLGVFMIVLDALIVNVALPDLQASFHVGEAGLQWVVAGYSIGMAVLMMASATIADGIGRRRTYVAGLGVFGVGSLVSGIAPTLWLVTAARFVQGGAAATVSVASLALISNAFPEPGARVRAIGYWTAITSTGTALGPTLGGVLTDAFGWRSVFLVNVPVAVIAIVLTGRWVVESKEPVRAALDRLGQVTFAVAVGSASFVIIQGQEVGWDSPAIIALALVALVSLVAFVVHEGRTAHPMMDLRLFLERRYAIAIGTVFAAYFTAYGLLLMVSQYVQDAKGESAIATGLLILPFAIGQLLTAPRAGAIASRVGARLPVLCGQALMSAGLVALIIGVDAGSVVLAIGLGLAGCGVGLIITPTTGIAMNAVPADRAGMASGILSTQRAIGSIAGYAVMGAVLATWLGASLDASLEPAIPDASARSEVASEIIDQANPHAYAAEVGPGRPLSTASPATDAAILDDAVDDFATGTRLALGVGLLVTMGAAAVVAIGFRPAPPVLDPDPDPAPAGRLP